MGVPAVGGCRARLVGFEASGNGCSGCWNRGLTGSSYGGGKLRAELVPGRDNGGVFRGLSKMKSESSCLLLGEAGRGAVDSEGWPKTRPVAAAATTVPDPIS